MSSTFSRPPFLLTLSLLVILVYCLSAQARPMTHAVRNGDVMIVPKDRGDGTLPMVELPGTQRLTIQSKIMGKEYALDISLPRKYSDTTLNFPVVYILDGQWDFPLVNAVYGGQYYDGFVPDLVLVGVSAGGPHPNFDSLRVGDLTPTTVPGSPQSGNGPKFLSFLKDEVIPLIESRYRVDHDDRALMGSSLGGLFTLYALFQEPGLFQKYILTSPALGWDKEVIFGMESNFASQHKQMPVRLFMGRGEMEMGGTEFQKFVDQLKSHAYEGLVLQTSLLEGMGHSGGKPLGYGRGMQFAYMRPTVELAPDLLDKLVGRYQLTPQLTVSFVRDGGRLILVAPDSTRIPLLASSENDFFVRGFYLFLTFQRDKGGAVTGVHAEQWAGGMFLKRLDGASDPPKE
jgi:predicted alpha/beta superfamily hydrolase